jgi:hypothetical protein
MTRRADLLALAARVEEATGPMVIPRAIPPTTSLLSRSGRAAIAAALQGAAAQRKSTAAALRAMAEEAGDE